MKGYQYLLPIAAPVAILAARGLCAIPLRSLRLWRWRLPALSLFTTATLITVLWLVVASVTRIAPANAGTGFLAGTGGVPGGKGSRPLDRRQPSQGVPDAGAWTVNGEHHPVLGSPEGLCIVGKPESIASQSGL